ncbi:MAG TPA: YncE family protein [Nitrospirota bacterium]|nr:YncE family protein [Nitrospirota bacterium]
MKSLIVTFLLLISVTAQAAPVYHVIKKLPVGGEGGWDYLTVDSAAHRLYISRSTHVMVIDTVTEKVVGDIPDTPGVHGIALAPELGRGFISNGKANTASIFDMKTLKVIGQVKTGENPDAILYEPSSQRVFTFNGKSKDATVFEATSGTVLATIALGGKPEFATTDNKGRVFVNIEDTNEVVELDSKKLAIVKRHSLRPCVEPSGMAIDIEHHQTFSGCHNKVMTVLDVDSGKVMATLPIGQGVDANAFDAETGLAFSSNGEGTLTIARELLPGKFYVETIPTQRGARTMAIDTKTHKIYLPVAEFAPAPAPTPEVPKPRPVMMKDSFAVLVVGK